MALEKFSPPGKWFLKLTLQIKWSTPSERASKSVHKNGVVSCVQFCLRSLGPLERCVAQVHHFAALFVAYGIVRFENIIFFASTEGGMLCISCYAHREAVPRLR